MKSWTNGKVIFRTNLVICLKPNMKNNNKETKKAYQSNFELTSKENVDSIGVIASSAVCSKTQNIELLDGKIMH